MTDKQGISDVSHHLVIRQPGQQAGPTDMDNNEHPPSAVSDYIRRVQTQSSRATCVF